MEVYTIVRFFAPITGKGPEVIKTGLTQQEAHKHCCDPTTRKEGVYFDGFTKEIQDAA
jgi:hypothetical protein